MKNKIYFVFFLMILLSGSVLAIDWPICIDLTKPNAPTGLNVISNLQLSWNAATDKPDCSGISYYNIYSNNVLIGTSTTTSYSGVALVDGTYSIAISAVDRAKNEGEKTTISVTFPLSVAVVNTNTGGGGGGGGGGRTPINTTNTTNTTNALNFEEQGTGISESENTDENEEVNEIETSNGFFKSITGAVIGAVGTGGGIAFVFVIIIAVGTVIVFFMKKKEKIPTFKPKKNKF